MGAGMTPGVSPLPAYKDRNQYFQISLVASPINRKKAQKLKMINK